MKTLLIQNNDIYMTRTSPVWISGVDALTQRLRHRLQLFLGEWIHRPSSGIDWFSILDNKFASENDVEELVRKELAKDPEIVSIESVSAIFVKTTEQELQYKKPKRSAVVEYTVYTIYGVLRGVG